MNTELNEKTEAYLRREDKRIKKNKQIYKGMAEYLTEKMTRWAMLVFIEEMETKIVIDSPTDLYYMCGVTSPKNTLKYSKRTKTL